VSEPAGFPEAFRRCTGPNRARIHPYTGRVVASSLIVAPSILAADFAHLAREARAVEGAADWLHVDVMDNHFVPNLTIGLPVVESLRKATTLPFDCHLMIDAPDRWAVGYAEAGSYNVTFHVEAAADPVGLAKNLRAAGSRAGLAIDRDTPIEPYLELLPHFDTLLIMTIKAGFGGQKFMPELLDKVRTARRQLAGGHLELRIEVDGGIAEDTIAAAAEAGADAFVAGTAVYGAADPAEAVRRLRRRAADAVTRSVAGSDRAGSDRAGSDRAGSDAAGSDGR
jgi:ribulose-phosphate 3-epimerase